VLATVIRHVLTKGLEMNIRRFVVPLFAAVLFVSSGWSMAADSHHPAETPQSDLRSPPMMDGKTMSNQMMGNHMMGGCPIVMGHLPMGNEKLTMQMDGEMMKAMGDIMLTYADRIQTPSSK
jgi:hypothetical protein